MTDTKLIKKSWKNLNQASAELLLNTGIDIDLSTIKKIEEKTKEKYLSFQQQTSPQSDYSEERDPHTELPDNFKEMFPIEGPKKYIRFCDPTKLN